MSAKQYWASFDEDDVLPIPGQPCRVGDILGDHKLEVRALVWSFLEVKAREAMRDAYQRAMAVPDMTDAERVGILTKAAVCVGLEVLDKFEKVDKERRKMAPKARAKKIAAKKEARWGAARELLRADPTLSAEALARRLRKGDHKVDAPPTPAEQSTFERYVGMVRQEMKAPHSLSE